MIRDFDYRSDFDFYIAPKGLFGDVAVDLNNDFRGQIFCGGRYTFGRDKGELYNCVVEGDRIHVVCDNHKLDVGQLALRFYYDHPNPLYADGAQTLTADIDLPICLVEGIASDATPIEVEVVLPLVSASLYDIAVANGYNGTQAEFFNAIGQAAAVADLIGLCARKDGGNVFSGAQTINGDLTINGNVTQLGESYISHAEEVRTPNAHITLREGATGGMGAEETSGLTIEKYNGVSDGTISIGADGEMRVGDVGDTQPLLTRPERSDIPDGALLQWEAATARAVPADVEITEMEITYEDESVEVVKILTQSQRKHLWLIFVGESQVGEVATVLNNVLGIGLVEGAVLARNTPCVAFESKNLELLESARVALEGINGVICEVR